MDTIAAFTLDGAYTEFAENKNGSLKPGLLADVVMLDADIEATPAAELSRVKPSVTICYGV
jgi:predicted amidohydrolase YtcJ